jgi:hypothetical protein
MCLHRIRHQNYDEFTKRKVKNEPSWRNAEQTCFIYRAFPNYILHRNGDWGMALDETKFILCICSSASYIKPNSKLTFIFHIFFADEHFAANIITSIFRNYQSCSRILHFPWCCHVQFRKKLTCWCFLSKHRWRFRISW